MMLLAAALATAALLPGVYTNEEQVYFATEAGKPAPPWTGLRITADGDVFRVEGVDSHGAAVGADAVWRVLEAEQSVSINSGGCTRAFARVATGLEIVEKKGVCGAGLTTLTAAGIGMTAADGTLLTLQRSRAFKCWASIPRKALKDGKTDWWFQQGLMLHDVGGRVTVTTDEPMPQTFSLRMRNVVWPNGNNAPSLVLYVHGEDPDHAIAYSWADPLAKRVGINLRTMQASCTLVEPKS